MPCQTVQANEERRLRQQKPCPSGSVRGTLSPTCLSLFLWLPGALANYIRYGSVEPEQLKQLIIGEFAEQLKQLTTEELHCRLRLCAVRPRLPPC
jgi:hypothetical protein